MLKRIVPILFFLTGIILSCTSKHDKTDFELLARLDSLISTNPQLVVDSLKKIPISSLSKYNYGYYLLLDVISKDKTYYEFHSDSLIKLSVKRLSAKKKQYPYNYARGLMYAGIVRLRMGVTDSVTYDKLKKSTELFEKYKIDADYYVFLCYYYLGIINNKNNNKDLEIKYFQKTLKLAESIKDANLKYVCYSNLFWSYVSQREYESAEFCLSRLDSIDNNIIGYEEDTKLAVSSLLKCNGKTHESLEIDKAILNNKEYKTIDRDKLCFRISKNYFSLNNQDSALLYMEKAIANLRDTTYVFNYYYYLNLGEITEKSQLWQKSALAYKKAYELKNKAVSKELDKNILELEKKYDLTQAENTALHFRTRAVLLGFLSILLIVLLISFTIIIRQKSRQTNLRIRLAEQKNLLLEQEKLKIERSLIEKEFVLPIYQQISQRNANLKGLLYDLKTNVYISKNPQLAESISSMYADFVSVSEIKPDKFLSDEKFKSITGIDEAKSAQLNESDKMLIVFIVLEIDTRQIAVLFNTSESSIRGRKTKLRVKLESLNIDFST